MSFDFPGTAGLTNVIVSDEVVTTGKLITIEITFNQNVADGGGGAGGGAMLWEHGPRNTEHAWLRFIGGNKLEYGRGYVTTNSKWETEVAIFPIKGWQTIVLTHDATLIGTHPIAYSYKPGGPIFQAVVGAGLVRTLTGAGAARPDNQLFRIGNNNPVGDVPFNGKINSFTVWKNVKTPLEVRTIIYKGAKADQVDLAFGWDMTTPPLVPPNIDDWSPASVLGVPTGITHSTVNPPRIGRAGPVVVV